MPNPGQLQADRVEVAGRLRCLVDETRGLKRIVQDPAVRQMVRASAGGPALHERLANGVDQTLDAAVRALHVAERPFGLAIVGPLNSGKSTLVAGLFPEIERLLPIRSQDSTGVATRISSRVRAPRRVSSSRLQLLPRGFFETGQWDQLPQGFFDIQTRLEAERSADEYLLIADKDVTVLSDKSWPTTVEGWCRPQQIRGDQLELVEDAPCWGYRVSGDGRRLERVIIRSDADEREALPLYLLMAWIREIQVFWDHEWLEEVDVLDMPGLGAIVNVQSEERGELYRQFDPVFTQKNAALFREYAAEERIDGLVVVRAGDPAATIPKDFQEIFCSWNDSNRTRLVFLVLHKADLLFSSTACDALLDTMLWTNTVERLFASGRPLPDSVFITMSREQAERYQAADDTASRWREEFERGGRTGVEKVKSIVSDEGERREIMKAFVEDGGMGRMRTRVGDILHKRAEAIRGAHLRTKLEALDHEALDLLRLATADVAPTAMASLEALEDSHWDALAKWRPDAQLSLEERISSEEGWEDLVLNAMEENWVRCAKSLAHGRVPTAGSSAQKETGRSDWVKKKEAPPATEGSRNGEADKVVETIVTGLVSAFREQHWPGVKNELRSKGVGAPRVVVEVIGRMLHGLLGSYWRERVLQLEPSNPADLGAALRAVRIAGVKDGYLHLVSGSVDGLPDDLVAALSGVGSSLRSLGVGEGEDA